MRLDIQVVERRGMTYVELALNNDLHFVFRKLTNGAVKLVSKFKPGSNRYDPEELRLSSFAYHELYRRANAILKPPKPAVKRQEFPKPAARLQQLRLPLGETKPVSPFFFFRRKQPQNNSAEGR